MQKVATLAKLEFTEIEKEKLTLQLSEIVSYFKKLNELDTDDITPGSHQGCSILTKVCPKTVKYRIECHFEAK